MRGKMVFLSRTAYHRGQSYSRIHMNDTLPFNPTQKAAAQTGGHSTIFHYGRPTRAGLNCRIPQTIMRLRDSYTSLPAQ